MKIYKISNKKIEAKCAICESYMCRCSSGMLRKAAGYGDVFENFTGKQREITNNNLVDFEKEKTKKIANEYLIKFKDIIFGQGMDDYSIKRKKVVDNLKKSIDNGTYDFDNKIV